VGFLRKKPRLTPNARQSLAGSMIVGIREIQEVLNFCRKNSIDTRLKEELSKHRISFEDPNKLLTVLNNIKALSIRF
jgi:D-arabinose 1-dehydrogenase-like Zn-dependent alcohol dehydrogenase